MARSTEKTLRRAEESSPAAHAEQTGEAPACGAAAPESFALEAVEREAKEHFLKNIRQLGNKAILMRRLENGRMEPVFISEGFAQMMECTVPEAWTLYSGRGFFKTTDPEDRPLVRSMLKNRVAYDGGATLTVQKITAKKNRIWCSIHYAFIDDYGENYVYCTYSDVTALKQYEEKFRSTYTALGNSFYQVNDRTLSMVRVNLTRDCLEEVRGKDRFDSDSISFSFSECTSLRAEHFPILTERERFLRVFDVTNLCEGYLKGNTNVSLVLYSIRRDGRSCFVRITASITRHPLSGDLTAFITETECNSDKVLETLTDRILAQQFDMVCYLVNGQYGVTIGETVRSRRGNIFPVTASGSYQNYLTGQVYPVLIGDEREKEQMARALFLETVEQKLREKEPYVVDIAVEIEGETFYKQFDFYSIDPEAKFYILLKSDTTEIQKAHLAMNEQMQQALDAANQANVAKTAFLSSMSHEIRTPMNAIIGLDNIALNDPDLPPRTRDYLEKIGASAKHLLGLINDILDMSRIESGRMSIRNEEFSFVDMLSQINTMAEGQCREKGLHYVCRVLDRLEDYYVGDALKLKQVLINILGNAVKFTPSPGEVSLLVEKTGAYEEQSALRFTIRDTGIGMEKSYIPHIFDAFSQENTTAKNRYGSTGLGMAITKNIIEMMNGSIRVESEKGKGSTFIVTIPLRNSTRKAETGSSADKKETGVYTAGGRAAGGGQIYNGPVSSDSANGGPADGSPDGRNPDGGGSAGRSPGGGAQAACDSSFQGTADSSQAVCDQTAGEQGSDGLRNENAGNEKMGMEEQEQPVDLTGRMILLAEDMLINAEIMKELLKMQGMEVEHAQNGEEAVEFFNSRPAGYYDAILMDLRMPVMDGLTAAAHIRGCGHEDADSIPIIALTANAFEEDVQRSLQAGMNAHLSKPVEPDQLYNALADHIGRRKV